MPEQTKIRFFTVPNILTLLNLLCGCAAVLYALRFDALQMAFGLIIAAAVLDFLDGFAARMLKQYSPLGRELDSLADMVSFGVAPAAILYSIFQDAGGIGAWGLFPFVLVLFSALRLARFNIDEGQRDEFIGLPTPACALFVAAAGYTYAAGLFTVQPWFVLLTAAFLSLLLIAPVRMFSLKFKGFGWQGNQLRYVFMLCALAALLIWGIPALVFIMVGYVLVSLVRDIAGRGRAA